MLKDITKIKIEGGIFDTLTQFDFFNPFENNTEKTIKGALLYGRNGTGKSTIAKAFRKLSGGNVTTEVHTMVFDKTNQSISLSNEDKKHIFVFDEDYIDKNVKFQQDHLDTIIMLGEAADLTEKIEKAAAEYEKARKEFEQQDLVFKEYNDTNSLKSPKYYRNAIDNALRGDDNWAGRDKEIHDKRQNTGVREDTYLQFVSILPSKSKTDLIVDYKTKLKELKEARTGTSLIDKEVPKLSDKYQKFYDITRLKILAEVIEKPELSAREIKLLDLLQNGKGNDLSDRLNYFKSKKGAVCPYCFQQIDDDYRESLVNSIEKVLSKIVAEHQQKLLSYILDPIDLDLNLYVNLDGYQLCIELLEKINQSINNYNVALKKKHDNPYEPIVIVDYKVQDLISQLTDALSSLEEARHVFNIQARKTEPLINELNKINNEIAHYDIADLVAQYDKQINEQHSAKEKREKTKIECDEKEKRLRDLEMQRSNVHLAVDTINACLKYIFFAEDRLRIEYDDGAYKLLSYGKSVKPCDISVGERNIIGLCYFFTNILAGKEEQDAYKEEYLLVIDDPVSSYDMENRIGINSFLKYKLSLFLEGNLNTKVLIMTHDLNTYYEIYKVLDEIVNLCKQKGYQSAPKFNCFELREKNLEGFSNKKRHEYTNLLEVIYQYANGKADNYELVIGNMMRQVLEAYSTFEYKKGIIEVSNDEKILNLLPEKKYVAYYKNLMYRLVLHGGSHKEDQVKTMNDFNFFSLISDVEKKRTAKDVLCFIYLLNKPHLLEHLKSCGNVEPKMESWCQDIKERAAII